jgi:hypothetical protein
MRQLTLEERLACYEHAKWYIRLLGFHYICLLLEEQYQKITKELIPKQTEIARSHFPEFYAQKPDTKHEGEAWFLRGDIESRIKALENAISLIKEKIN